MALDPFGRDLRLARSSVGRLLGEYAAWMPSALLPSGGAQWRGTDDDRATVYVLVDTTFMRLDIGIERGGAVRDIAYARWGDLGSGTYRWVPFGMLAEAERTFDGVTIVSQGRVGWWYGTRQWRSGEFFRFTIDDLHPAP